MTEVPLSSKIALTGGADFWHTNAVPEAGLPKVMLTDGPHGVRKQAESSDQILLNESIPATCFPTAVGLSSTWDRELLSEVGAALGVESKALGVGVLLGPGANIKRSPLCGRNFEYFSEDPFLTGELAAAYVNGVQSQGVGTSVKHFAVNNQETDRMRRDSVVDERTLREVYLRGFGKIIRSAQPWTVMCSYNKINGLQAAENRFLLTQILREEWGFEGFVMSDWGAVRDRVASLKAGLDLQMPADGGAGAELVAQAVESGELDAATIEAAYARLERVLRRVADAQADAPDSFDSDAHHALARRAASEAIVLLSNNGILPLSPHEPKARIAVIGEFARTPRYQGAGSSRVNPTRLDSALDAIAALVGHDVAFAPGFTTVPSKPVGEGAHAQAVAVARDADIVLAFLGLGENHESEGYDRTTLALPTEQLILLDEICALGKKVVVVLSNGASVMLPFADKVDAVVEGWLGGQGGGAAIADVLFGVVNPSGKLAETIPVREQDVPSYLGFPGDASGVRYAEGLFVGYRGYDALAHDVAYCFGHGLSYTTFAYWGLEVTVTEAGLSATVTVTNTGTRAGREVVQAYVSVPDSSVVRVPRELKGFADVTLEAGESQEVTIEIPLDELAYYSVPDASWVVEGGRYVVEVGASSRDLRESATVELAGDEPARPLNMESTATEIMARPTGAAEIAEVGGAIFSGDPDQDPDLVKLFSEIPAFALAGFIGIRQADMRALIERVNGASQG